jgi:hypothetical protein
MYFTSGNFLLLLTKVVFNYGIASAELAGVRSPLFMIIFSPAFSMIPFGIRTDLLDGMSVGCKYFMSLGAMNVDVVPVGHYLFGSGFFGFWVLKKKEFPRTLCYKVF